MFVIMSSNATTEQFDHVNERIHELGYKTHPIKGDDRFVIGITGNKDSEDRIYLEGLPGVSRVVRITKAYKLASREIKQEDTIVQIGSVRIGGGSAIMIAGPCAVESREQTLRIVDAVAERGAHMIRGGAYKPRTSPYSFQGLGEEGLIILAETRERTGLPFVTEVVDAETAALAAQYADMLQVGTRNMQNFNLLTAVGKLGKPVLMKRGMSATLDETLMSAEYLMSNGARDVVICERGVRTFTNHSRNTLDLSIIPAIKAVSHLPVVVDPSHASGKRDSVIPLGLAGIAAGGDGLLVDVHDDPEHALVDGPQALLPDMFGDLMTKMRRVAEALDRPMAPAPTKANAEVSLS